MKYTKKLINGKPHIVINTSDGFDNWSQRKSQYVFKQGNVEVGASWWCNVHAYTDALAIAGYKLYSDKYPELSRYPDKLCKFCCENDDVDNFYKSRAYSCWKYLQDAKSGLVSKEEFRKNGLMPVNVHNVLCYAVNKFVGGPDAKYGDISTFSTEVPVDIIIHNIIVKGLPVVTSGTYGNLAGHIVALVGLAYSLDELSNIPLDDNFFSEVDKKQISPAYAIVDDPWGDMNRKNYDGVGNDVVVAWDKFISESKPTNSKTVKYAHLFKGAIATV